MNLIVWEDNRCGCGGFKNRESKICKECKSKNKTNLSKTISLKKEETYQKFLAKKRKNANISSIQ